MTGSRPPWPGDHLADRIAQTTPSHRQAVIGAMAEGDVIARHLEVEQIPGIIRAAWVMAMAVAAASIGDDREPALRAAATALLLEQAPAMGKILDINTPDHP